jgi:Gas vesicle synthesis protein GvpL/GvpF
MAEAALGRYVYCVVPAGATVRLDGVRGVDPERPIETVREGDVAAVTGWVSLAEFGAEPLKRNLNDLDWLERTARAHQAVLDRALASGAIVPLRMCTVFAGDDHVRAMLRREHEALSGALTRLRGRQEWGVKLMADVRRLHEAARDEAEPASGRAYLERKGRERREEEETRRLATQAAEEVHAGLTAQAAAATLLRPQSRELTGRTGEMVLNGAYLVDGSRVEEFRAVAAAQAERQRPRGLELEVTGPWPPYNFVAP